MRPAQMLSQWPMPYEPHVLPSLGFPACLLRPRRLLKVFLWLLSHSLLSLTPTTLLLPTAEHL